VGGFESFRNLDRQLQRAIYRQAAFDHMLEGLPFKQLHGDERALFGFADVVDRADMRVVQGRGCTRLSLETLQRHRISLGVLGKELKRNAAAEPGVFGLVHHPHATTAQLLEDPVMRSAGHGRAGIIVTPQKQRQCERRCEAYACPQMQRR
jgi:hypothetical protein